MTTKEILETEIYPQLDIESLLSELNPKKYFNYYKLTCPSCGKKEAYIPNRITLKPIIICNRKNKCGYISSIWNYLKDSRDLSNREILHLLADYAGYELPTLNKKYNYYQKPKKPIIKIKYKKTLLTIPTNYLIIDNQKYIKNFKNLNEIYKFQTIITFIYYFSLTQNSKKTQYYKNRKITKIPKNIGFLSHQNIPILNNLLKQNFPIEELEYFGIFKNRNFKFYFSEFCVIPSFDIFSTQISAIRLRNIYPSKIKEIEISHHRIANPLPYGITRENLEKFDSFIFTEGHIDALSLGIENFVAIEGINSFNPYNLGLFLDKKIYIVFDMDTAGQNGAKKLQTYLNKLNIKNEIITWDIKYGKDINEVLQNNHLEIFSFISSKNSL